MDEFDYEIEIDVRFRDIDVVGHVNNAVFATYIEQARVQYIEDVVGDSIVETSAVIANIEIDFRRPIDWGESVTVGVRATDLGNSSVPIEYEIRSDGEVAATAETLLVTFDPEAGESRPLPDAWRESIAAHEGL